MSRQLDSGTVKMYMFNFLTISCDAAFTNQALEQEVCKLGETLGEADTNGQRQEKQQV